MTGIFKINNNEVFGSDGTFSGTIGSNATFPDFIKRRNLFQGILLSSFVNGGGFATAFSVEIPSSALVADGNTLLSIYYSLTADNGGSTPEWRYTMSGGITAGATYIVDANSATNTGVFNVNIPSSASDITINIGTQRASGGNNTASAGSYILVTENPQ